MESAPKLKKKEGLPGGRVMIGTEKIGGASPEEINQEQEELQEDCRLKYPEATQLLDSIVDEIDQEALKDISAEYAQRAGVESRRLNHVERDRIFMLDEKDFPAAAVMAYNTFSNSIGVNTPYFDARFREHEEHILATFSRLYIHEQTHASGVVGCVVLEEGGGGQEENTEIRIGTGFDVMYKKMSSRTGDGYGESRIFELFNEGITERISDEVFLEYVRRTAPEWIGGVSEAASLIESTMLHDRTSYGAARHFLMALTSALAEGVGVPEDVVWRGFVRQYYSGELRQDEIIDLLDRTFGPEFSHTLMNVKSAADIRELALKFPAISAQYPGIAERWLERLHIARGAK